MTVSPVMFGFIVLMQLLKQSKVRIGFYWSHIIGAGTENRTLVFYVEGNCSTIELQPLVQILEPAGACIPAYSR